MIEENNINNYQLTFRDNNVVIVPSGILNSFRNSSFYDVVLNNVTDIDSQVIEKVNIKFFTKIVPLYSSVKLIRSNLGSLIKFEKDEDILLLIYENSLYVYNNSKNSFLIDQPPKEAIDYVTCKTKLDLLYRIYMSQGNVLRKSLGDLTVEYGPVIQDVVRKKLDSLENCVKKNELLLMTGYGFVQPTSAVKSDKDKRKPTWQRLISEDF